MREPARCRDVNQIATCGVRRAGWIAAKTPGSAAFSASANTSRDPKSVDPAVCPPIEITDPTPTSSAPADPMTRSAASATGVVEAATSGSVVIATICTRIINTVTVSVVATSAKGRSRRGSRASPARMPIASNPPTRR